MDFLWRGNKLCSRGKQRRRGRSLGFDSKMGTLMRRVGWLRRLRSWRDQWLPAIDGAEIARHVDGYEEKMGFVRIKGPYIAV